MIITLKYSSHMCRVRNRLPGFDIYFGAWRNDGQAVVAQAAPPGPGFAGPGLRANGSAARRAR